MFESKQCCFNLSPDQHIPLQAPRWADSSSPPHLQEVLLQVLVMMVRCQTPIHTLKVLPYEAVIVGKGCILIQLYISPTSEHLMHLEDRALITAERSLHPSDWGHKSDYDHVIKHVCPTFRFSSLGFYFFSYLSFCFFSPSGSLPVT